MNARSLTIAVLFAGCGDDGVNKLPDAPLAPDASSDAPADMPIDTAVLPDATPMLTMGTTFAANINALCGIAYDQTDNTIWAYACSGATINHYSATGTPLGTIARPGEAADDADLDVASAALTIGTTAVAAGDVMFTNGETGVAELYLPEASANVALTTMYGDAHIVGGAFHIGRNSVYMVQDRNGGANANRVVEINPATGAVITNFPTLPMFEVNYGDIEVCQSTGNLLLVSSFETTLALFTPLGVFIAEYPLPVGVTNASGIALEPGGAAWISSTTGDAIRMTGLPCD